MINHIVMMKLQTSNESEKTKYLRQLKQALKKLPSLISQIRYYEIGINVSQSPAAYDLVLVSHFDSLSTLDSYRNHPEHVKVLELIKTLVASTAVVDFEF